jgi:hypothetical protein
LQQQQLQQHRGVGNRPGSAGGSRGTPSGEQRRDAGGPSQQQQQQWGGKGSQPYNPKKAALGNSGYNSGYY